MWSAVAPADVDSPAPSARSKHSATLVGEHVFLLVTGKWQLLKPSGDKLPSLQEHSAVAYKDNIYVFGGEVGFSAGTETPLWCYDIKNNSWRKIRSKKGVATPKGRRGHTALIHRGNMLIYGGYQDLRGSCSELWAFHFETESWHLLSTAASKANNIDVFPPPRHKHSAIIHDDAMWIYGGMTDLQERGDLWKWDIVSKTWNNIKTKINPGPLHSHAVCKLPSSMLLFGGERNGHPINELWKFNFSIESWEKITISGTKPQPRSESIAFTVSELLLTDSSSSLENKSFRVRSRTCISADRNSRHSSYLPNNRVAPCEKTYIFQPSQTNYTDGSDLAQQYSESKASRSFLQEISKISQISRLNSKCSYTVLTGCTTDSTESLLKQHASPPNSDDYVVETEIVTPSRGTMVKSKSAYVIKKKYQTESDEQKELAKKRVEFDCGSKKMPREPISVPNFSVLTLPTPVLTPVEAAKLVYLDTDDENDLINDVHPPDNVTIVKANDSIVYENFNPVKRGESYSSHLGYADNPLYQHMMKLHCSDLPEQENVSSTSDYASIETMNRLSSASNYSVKTNTPQEENHKNRERDGPFGFCNPNYMGPDIKALLNSGEKKNIAKLLTSQNSKLHNSEEDLLELQDYNGIITKNTKVYYRNSTRDRPPKFLALENNVQRPKESKHRALSAGRVERNRIEKPNPEQDFNRILDPFVPLHIYIIGGKEQGQVTVFQRPISIWKLKLF
ncbi:uncharacterized protein BDFB_005577 [Asbolus verrucosus]|uniref:Uncharacterized protein n=1 Tax=Asbolus verrucosus TaxID=1661398 RepID=A0A482WCW9_ASBVE|nr:uncharacterized protein BDFB_005577 [Asbolus verrucosus]